MDSTQMKWEGRWDQLKGRVQQTWGNLTDDDPTSLKATTRS
jgi:uncharacterized protein YjbJ (UPF0337 family)